MKTRLTRTWALFVAVMNLFAIAQVLGFVSIFSNRELTEKLASMTADEITKTRNAFRELMNPHIREN